LTAAPEVRVAGERLRLLPQRAALLCDAGLLLVADLHLGKAQSFRRLGVPVPEGTTAAALARLDDCLAATGARGIVFLGDLIHSARARSAASWDAVARWRERHAALTLTLVRGNHDRHAGDPPAAWGVACVEAPWHPTPGRALALAHHPDPVTGAYVLAGHLHPGAWIDGRAHDRLRLPCFHFGATVGVLPAFGPFTGGHALKRAPGDRVFVVHDAGVSALP
jgi:DNA ligase-associated metallophosphoesterase